MAGSGQLDALVVAGPPELHAEIARHCLERKIHVFVEKPPAPNSRMLADLVALEAQHPDVATFVGFNFPYGASYVEFRGALAEHTTPRVLKIRFVSSAPCEPRWACKDVFETLLLGTAIHPINMAVRLFGAARSVTSRVVDLSNGRLYLLLAVQFAHGNQAFLEVGNFSVRFEYRCELIGDGGVTGVLDQHNELSFTGIRAASADGRASLWDKCEMRYRWPSRRGGFERTGYQPELCEFHRSILRGARSDSTFGDAVETYRVMDAAMEGAR
jgi:predicted dehydrogenase